MLECVFGSAYVQGDWSGKLGKISRLGERALIKRQASYFLDIFLKWGVTLLHCS